jgi:TonB-dependent SusC/RagA subfamily outer membrane receptor
LKTTRFLLAFALAIGSTACVAERAVAPQAVQSSIVSQIAPSSTQVPLLFVVDGVRYQRDQVPALSAEEISQVTVLKGTAALRRYGHDAAYGVVIIKTKMAVQSS